MFSQLEDLIDCLEKDTHRKSTRRNVAQLSSIDNDRTDDWDVVLLFPSLLIYARIRFLNPIHFKLFVKKMSISI